MFTFILGKDKIHMLLLVRHTYRDVRALPWEAGHVCIEAIYFIDTCHCLFYVYVNII